METSTCSAFITAGNPSTRSVRPRRGLGGGARPLSRHIDRLPRRAETFATGGNGQGSDVKGGNDNGDDTGDAASWTPFSLPEADPCKRPRLQRMVETRRGDLYVEEPTHDRDTMEKMEATEATETMESVDATDSQCSHCQGSGRQMCAYCNGTGRTNYKDRVMLPKGVWPIWCSRCIRCSGMTICSCCLGSGKKREPIGFRV